MEDENLKKYNDPSLRHKEYLEFCDTYVPDAITEIETFRYYNEDHNELIENEMDNH